jgi:hypothetical protein
VLTLKVEFPDWSGRKTGSLSTGVSGAPGTATHTLTAGQYAMIEIALPASSGLQTVEISGADDFPLPAPDGRRRTGRLVSAQLIPAAP